MHANWQSPYPLADASAAVFAAQAPHIDRVMGKVPAVRKSRRDNFDYRLIFGVCLIVFFWAGLIERCNPLFWSSKPRMERGSIWSETREAAHRCTSLALQG